MPREQHGQKGPTWVKQCGALATPGALLDLSGSNFSSVQHVAEEEAACRALGNARPDRRPMIGTPCMSSAHRNLQALVYIIGYNKQQYENLDEAVDKVSSTLHATLNVKYGKGAWAVIYGGDPLDAAKPDIALLVDRLRREHGMTLIAVQALPRLPPGVRSPESVAGDML